MLILPSSQICLTSGDDFQRLHTVAAFEVAMAPAPEIELSVYPGEKIGKFVSYFRELFICEVPRDVWDMS
jgi:hypothetical protein